MKHDPTLYKSRPHTNRGHLHLRISPAEVTASTHRQFQGKPPVRGEIKTWSEQSRKRLKWTLRNSAGFWFTMITLTYQEPPTASDAKRHLNAFLQALRRRNISYLWAVELQKRGAIHFHIYTSSKWLPITPLRASWCNITGNPAQSINLRWVHRPYYILKYVSKSVGSTYPLGRYWGTSYKVPTTTLIVTPPVVRALRKYAERHRPVQPRYAIYLPTCALSPPTLHRLLVYHGLADPITTP